MIVKRPRLAARPPPRRRCAAAGPGCPGCGSTGLTARAAAGIAQPDVRQPLRAAAGRAGQPEPSAASLHSHASCQKGTPDTPQNGSGIWLCEITYLVAGPGYPVIAKYNVDVQTDGCYAADGDGPASVNGSPTITGPHYQQLINPLSLIDGCFDIA